MHKLETNLTRSLGIRLPFLQGGMGNISPASLCIAVSKAGGLGQIGVGNSPLEVIEEKLRQIKSELVELPFGVNVPLMVHPNVPEVMELVNKYKVPVVSLSAGNPQSYIPKLKEHGIKIIAVVATVKQAIKAADAGADVLVAEGVEAAGKNSPRELSTMTLIPQIAEAVDLPLAAAGGIGDGRGLLAAFSLGASGIQMGTRLIATQEAKVHPAYQQALLQAGDEDTIVIGRLHGFVTRLLKTPYAELVRKKELQGEGLGELQARLDEESHHRGAMEGRLEEGHLNAGLIAGLIKDIPTVEALFHTMVRDANNRYIQLKNYFGEGDF